MARLAAASAPRRPAASTRPLCGAPRAAPVRALASSANAGRDQDALAEFDRAYYNEGAPLISDDAYDSLKRRAAASGAPARVGAPPPDTGLPKARHPSPLLSLDAVHSRAEAEAWGAKAKARLAKAAAGPAPAKKKKGKGKEEARADAAAAPAPADQPPPTAWCVEPKLDGLALRLTYVRGVLAQAATRGDGSVGEDVTPAAARAAGVPRELKGYAGDAEVRGEVFMTFEDFEAANAAEAASGRTFSNPRNLAAATLRAAAGALGGGKASASAEAAAKRRLSFAAYGLELPPGTPGAPDAQSGSLTWLAAAGVGVPADAGTVPTFAAALDAAEAWMARRATLGHAVDGAVIKADALAARAALGDGPAAPRWAVAWKFPALEAVTTLTGVSWQLGRTGALVPVAELAAVDVGGVTVTRASLHNAASARGLGLLVGDSVVVQRAGDVVPQVVRALPELRTGGERPWDEPSSCPACGSAVAPAADALRCPNPACAGRALRRAQHFAASLADGVGPGTVAALVDGGVAADAADLVTLDPAALAALPGFGARRAAKVAAALADGARAAAPGDVLGALGLPGVGPTTGCALVAALGSLPAVATAAEADLASVPGVGAVTASAVAAWFAVDDNAALVARLQAAGVGVASVAPASASDAPPTTAVPMSQAPPAATPSLAGLSVVLTGTLEGCTRADTRAAVQAAGGRLAPAVSGSTDLVVVGDAPGRSKLAKAAQLGVPVVHVSDFFDLGDGGALRVVWEPAEHGDGGA